MRSLSSKDTMLIQPPAARACALLEGAGHAAFVVGGCVRDTLMGRPCHDWDVATSALPDETMRVFRGCRAIATGLRHGTVTVLLDGEPIEITTFRTEGSYSDGRHPDGVRFAASIEEDLSRRDFTMNAVAYSARAGFVDPFGGREDIARGVIRCVGDAQTRFSEDGLRILRAVRFASQLGFDVGRGTEEGLYRCAGMLGRISAERKASELEKLLCAPFAARTVGRFAPLLRTVLPVSANAAALLSRLPASRTLRFAALLSDCAPQDAQDVLRGLKTDKKLLTEVGTLLSALAEPLPETVPDLRRAIGRYGALWEDILTFRAAFFDEKSPPYRSIAAIRRETEAVLARNDCCTAAALAIGGNDLRGLGLAGPEVGRTLRRLLDAVIDGRLPNERKALLDVVNTTSVGQPTSNEKR